MNQSILYSALLSILTVNAFADVSNNPAEPSSALSKLQPQAHTTLASALDNPSMAEPQAKVKSAVVNPTTPAENVLHSKMNQAPVTTTAPLTTTIDCNYQIPSTTLHIEPNIIKQWTEKATQQSFNFDYNNIDAQLKALKACYTEDGWKSFNTALEKSGNLEAIQKQKLTVSSMINGQLMTSNLAENQWKVIVPLQVSYQNDKEKMAQQLNVELVVGRKPSGDLGIMKMIASPHAAIDESVQAPIIKTTP